MKKIKKANIQKVYPKRTKLSRFKTVFYLDNNVLIEKYNWFYYSFLILQLPLKVALHILVAIYHALSELKSEDFGRTARTDEDICDSHIEILLKGLL